MIQLLDDFISQLYDEFPLPRLASNSAGDYTSRLICQLNARRHERIASRRKAASARPDKSATCKDGAA